MIKNIVITGASKGIGAKIANYFSLNKSYKVINISRKKNKINLLDFKINHSIP